VFAFCRTTRKQTALSRGHTDHISLDLDLDFGSPLSCSHDLEKVQGHRSFSSKVRVETNGLPDGGDYITFFVNVVGEDIEGNVLHLINDLWVCYCPRLFFHQ